MATAIWQKFSFQNHHCDEIENNLFNLTIYIIYVDEAHESEYFLIEWKYCMNDISVNIFVRLPVM